MVDGGATGGAYGGDAGNYKGVMLCNCPSDSSPAGGPEIKPERRPRSARGCAGGADSAQPAARQPDDERQAGARRARPAQRRGPRGRPTSSRSTASGSRDRQEEEGVPPAPASLAAQATRNKKFVAYSSTLRDAVRGRQAELAADGPHAQPDLDRSAAASAKVAPAPPRRPPRLPRRRRPPRRRRRRRPSRRRSRRSRRGR